MWSGTWTLNEIIAAKINGRQKEQLAMNQAERTRVQGNNAWQGKPRQGNGKDETGSWR
jgi:hypothetical protein